MLLKMTDISTSFGSPIIDADSTMHKDYLKSLNEKLKGGSDAIQGYFGIMNPEESWLTKLMTIPGVLKFKIRYACKDKIRLSCPLMGNGMCFSRKIIKEYGWNAFSITENWEYFIKLFLKGHLVSYAEDAIIYSHAVTKLSHGEAQRKRWFIGRLNVLIDYYKPIFHRLIKTFDIKDTLSFIASIK